MGADVIAYKGGRRTAESPAQNQREQKVHSPTLLAPCDEPRRSWHRRGDKHRQVVPVGARARWPVNSVNRSSVDGEQYCGGRDGQLRDAWPERVAEPGDWDLVALGWRRVDRVDRLDR